MATAYLFFVATNMIEYLFVGGASETDIQMFQAITLIIAVSQAALFTLVFYVFYVWFALRFINYAHRFQVIEHVLENDT